LFNNIRSPKHIPRAWKLGLVVSVHKKGDKNKCENYKGISLLSTTFRLYANVLKNKLNKQIYSACPYLDSRKE